MKLPPQIQMLMLMHGSGAKGMSVYVYGNHEHGVYQTSRKENRHASWATTFEYAGLPEMAFTTYAELIEAADAVTPEQLAAERAKYPKLVDVEPVKEKAADAYRNRCRLCPRDGQPHHEKHRVHIAIDHVGVNDWFFGLCDEHLPLTKDPKALVEALQAEADSRKARAAERGGL